jgi:hypothetical protein
MAEVTVASPAIAQHGGTRLPSVEVDSYNLELKDEEGFLGDRATKRAFQELLEKWRKPLRKGDEDPFGKKPSEQISKSALDKVLTDDNPEAAALVHSAIEDFAQELAYVSQRFSEPRGSRSI